ncbi:MAG: transferrin receptor-like dimerization domain-containing protein [Acidobacteriota bacterium]
MTLRRSSPSFVLAVACLIVPLFALPLRATGAEPPLQGFSTASAAEQRALEARFDAELRADDLRDWMRQLSAHPHHVGSPAGKTNAELIASWLKSFGFDTHIEEFDVLFPTPQVRILEMVSPTRFTARLTEPPVGGDATSNQSQEQLPTYNAYSIDGDVTGDLVYANFGLPKDYDALAQHGIDVKGKIVIVRYGASWRGIKPKVAAEHGALGCIIYSDPHDDGYFQGDVYPQGAWRNENGAQRGSVADMPLYAGDPLTPFIAATKGAKRLALKDAQTLTTIPVLPISYGDALPLLAALGGPVAPESWRGSLATTYHLGPGPARVHLKLQFDWSLKPARDVIAVLKGSEYPDQWVVRGNHHDAWVNGANDPLSGLVSMLAEARAIGLLAKDGFKPKRTLVYAAWDGEEPGLIGSTEWVEAHADELQAKAVAYINSDTNGRGFVGLDGAHSLEHFLNQVTRDVTDPEAKVSVRERARALQIARGDAEAQKEARSRDDLRLSALGSGSDFTPFLQHLGLAALNLGYGGEDGGGSYHSVYDSFAHYTRFGDPGFVYGVTMAETGGRVVLRLAQADTLPLTFTPVAEAIAKYTEEVGKLAADMRKETEETNRRLADKTDALVADPQLVYVAPQPKDAVPFLNFAPLENTSARVTASAAALDKAIAEKAGDLSPENRSALDARLRVLERALTRAEGLPGRPWYVHQIYAPGRYTGYGVKTLPAVREAIELRHWSEAETQIGVVSGVLGGYADALDQAAAMVTQAAHATQ